MDKKILPILAMAIILATIGLSTLVVAKKSNLQDKLHMMNTTLLHFKPVAMASAGIGVDIEKSETKPVMILIIKQRNSMDTYLILDGELHKLEQISEELKLETRTKIIKYETNNSSILTVIVQNFNNNGISTVTGVFNSLVINFEPLYGHKHPPKLFKALEESNVIGTIENETSVDIMPKYVKPIENWGN